MISSSSRGLHHAQTVAGCAADVAIRLDLRAGVDIGDHGRVRMLGAQAQDILLCHHIRHGTARRFFRQKHALFGAENFGGFGHEPYTAENDDVRLRIPRFAA